VKGSKLTESDVDPPPTKFDGIIGYFHDVLQALPDKRRKEYMAWKGGEALSVCFFTQSPSFLSVPTDQWQMQKGEGNAQSLGAWIPIR